MSIPAGQYMITNMSTKAVLGLSNWSASASTPIVARARKSDNANQVWNVNPVSGKDYTIACKNTGSFLTAPPNGPSTDNVQGNPKASNEANWNIELAGPNEYNIICQSQTNHTLDVKGGSSQDNTPIVIGGRDGSEHQVWLFQRM